MSGRTIEKEEEEVLRWRRRLSEALKHFDEIGSSETRAALEIPSPYFLLLECVALGFHIGQLVHAGSLTEPQDRVG